MPGLQRAQRGVRPRRRCRPAPCSTATSGCSTGQKVWTSLAHVSHWCFVIARTDPASSRHAGLSFLLVPMEQPGVEVRPHRADHRWRRVQRGLLRRRPHRRRPRRRRGGGGLAGGDGPARLRAWRVDARATGRVRARARPRVRRSRARVASIDDPLVRQRLVDAWIGLQLMRWNAMRSMSARGVPGPGGVDLEAVLGHVAPRARQPRPRPARCRGLGR